MVLFYNKVRNVPYEETYLYSKKRTLFLKNSQRITRTFVKILKPVKPLFYHLVEPAIGTLFLNREGKKRTLLVSQQGKTRSLLVLPLLVEWPILAAGS